MLIPLKAFLGATCLTGTLAAGGVIGFSDGDGKAGTEAEVLVVDETTTTTDTAPEEFVPEETTTTTATLLPPPPPPPPAPAPAPPAVVLPAAEAGQVNVTINGDVILVNGVNPLKGWTATVDREGDTIVVTFTRGDDSVRVLADIFVRFVRVQAGLGDIGPEARRRPTAPCLGGGHFVARTSNHCTPDT